MPAVTRVVGRGAVVAVLVATAAALGLLIAVVIVQARAGSLPDSTRDDLELDAEVFRHDDGLRVEVDVTVAEDGESVSLGVLSEGTAEQVSERLVVLHIGRVSEPYVMDPDSAPPRLFAEPGDTASAEAVVGGSREDDDPITPDELRDLDRVGVCVWAADQPDDEVVDEPAVCTRAEVV